jgi:antitoxin (DNA-binding transcriptional repressor) of toxin-antitoxin stability system
MKSVGIRELKNSLSEYLRRVRSGETVLVTDRGEVVAEIGPPGSGTVDPSIPPGLSALIRSGLATLGAPADATLYRPLPRRSRGKATSTQLLDDERGTR